MQQAVGARGVSQLAHLARSAVDFHQEIRDLEARVPLDSSTGTIFMRNVWPKQVCNAASCGQPSSGLNPRGAGARDKIASRLFSTICGCAIDAPYSTCGAQNKPRGCGVCGQIGYFPQGPFSAPDKLVGQTLFHSLSKCPAETRIASRAPRTWTENPAPTSRDSISFVKT